MKRVRLSPRRQALAGALLCAALMLQPFREMLELSMQRHMLLQYPALLLAGFLLGRAVPPAAARWAAGWNALGISGMTAVSLILALLMIPRVLDLALVDARIEALKVGALVFAGAIVRPSWRSAGLIVQAFFVGGVVMMTIVAGDLYQDAPLRLCNAYRLDDQQRLGEKLVLIATMAGTGWVLWAGRRVMRQEALLMPPAGPERP